MQIISVDDSTALIDLVTEAHDATDAILRLIESVKGQEDILKVIDFSLADEQTVAKYSGLNERHNRLPSMHEWWANPVRSRG